VCAPSKVPSRTTSRHQKEAFNKSVKNPKVSTCIPKEKECIYNTSPKTVKNALKATTNGHGLASTI
jgi:hypothetical protein